MNKLYPLFLICLLLVSCDNTLSSQNNKKIATKPELHSDALQKRKSPQNDWEREALRGKVKSIQTLPLDEEASITTFDRSGRRLRDGLLGFEGEVNCHVYEYDSVGNPLRIYTEETSSFYDTEKGVNITDFFYDSIVNTYNDQGQLAFYETVGRGKYGYKNSFEYNDKGELMAEKRTDHAGELIYSMSYAYDKNGFITASALKKWDGNLKYKNCYENDSYGNVLREKYYMENGQLATTTYKYDKKGNPIEEEYRVQELPYAEFQKVYFGRELSKEEKEETIDEVEHLYQQYGTELSEEDKKMLSELDDLETGGEKSVRKTIRTFDEAGNCTSEAIYENGKRYEKVQNTYNQHNDLTKIELLYNGEEEASIFTWDYEYDAQGNWIKQVEKDNNGEIHQTIERKLEYYDLK
ncbi:hypothetical protein [Aureispira anguillae]|uniref:YD repeat-containing protein n=1 Tax=Aureispira anguillae TaxID=2864201 RepID=A0A916DRL0_9BACT|nr:hypothetical protein [Aureispira anguillae]BDS11331.1 hypothetical protein AsAng_0020430 [Aureispira anguillae]